MSDVFTVKVDGLKETVKALSKVDKLLRKEAGGVVREYAKKVQMESRRRMATSPGVSRKGYPMTGGAIIRRATATSASVGINRGNKKQAAIFAAEFGAGSQWIPYKKKADGSPSRKGKGRMVSQGSMKRRTFPVYRGNQFVSRGKNGPGWIVQPTIRKMVPKLEDDLEKDMMEVFERSMRRSGVRR